jgi:hypothetical protein
VPLADEVGRKKLIKLYGRDLPLGETLVAEAVQRTKGGKLNVKLLGGAHEMVDG